MNINMLQKKPASTVFSLIYIEKSADDVTLNAMVGPTLHKTLDEALNEVWAYVQKRLFLMKSEFIDASVLFDGHGIEFPKGIDGESISDSHFVDLLHGITGSEIQTATNWYFESVARDNEKYAFCQIDEIEIMGVAEKPVFEFNIKETELYKEVLSEAIQEVKYAANRAGVSPKGFFVNKDFLDFATEGGVISTSNLIGVVFEFACLFGKYNTPYQIYVINTLCDDINKAFSQ